MIEAQPTLDINAVQSAHVQYDAPTRVPPATDADGGRMMARGQTMQAQTAPVLPAAAGAVATTITAWQDGKKVSALWAINQDLNSWFGVAGVGWLRVANVDETSLTALTMLAAHARATGASVSYREDDGGVHEIYVW